MLERYLTVGALTGFWGRARNSSFKREDFYKHMVWIVDGKRRIRDRQKFMDGWDFATLVGVREDLKEDLRAGPLLRDWTDRNVPVLFDFGEDNLWVTKTLI